MSTQNYTRWALIASGEGGGRIASQFFARVKNPGIEDRIVVMNTNRADIRATIDRLQAQLGEDAEIDNAFTFGSSAGAGNDFAKGEEVAAKDLSRIVNGIDAAGIASDADVWLYTGTLGGGTGCGSIPYLIHEMKENPPNQKIANNITAHLSLAAWPYAFDGPQQHFNAVCGLSRLLRWYDGSQNADMVLLVSNSRVADLADIDAQELDQRERNARVNEQIKKVLDLVIAAGRDTKGIIDVRDYVEQPSQLDAYHFAPGIAMGMQSMFDLDFMFQKAADNAFVPMEPSTSRALYAIVRAPRHLIDAGEYTETGVNQAFGRWLDDAGYDRVMHRNVSLTPVERSVDEVDVLLLLGGFDLDPLLDESLDHYEQRLSFQQENASDGSDYFPAERYRQIDRNLEEYLDINRA